MFKREMTSVLIAVVGSMVLNAACGADYDRKVQFGSNANGQDPNCGEACPELPCYVDLTGPSYAQVGHWSIFYADEQHAALLRPAVASLDVIGNSWDREIVEVQDDPELKLITGEWPVDSTFDIHDDSLVASIDLGNGEPPYLCEYEVY